MPNIMRLIKAGILFLSLAACANGFAAEKIFTIGIVNAVSPHQKTVEGFMAGMAELGYVQGRDVNYIYSGIIEPSDPVLDAEIKRLISLKADLLLAVANEPALKAKKVLEKSDIPVLAVGCVKMVETGLVKELKHPEGNLTGIQVPDSQLKALEWLTIIVPNAKKIVIPYDPDDDASTIHLPGLRQTASKLGITLSLREIRSADDAFNIIGTLSPDASAVFLIPSQVISPMSGELIDAAIKRRMPLGTSVPVDDTALMSFGSDFFEMGQQAARLADQIRRGIRPSDLPVEIAEVFLNINVTTANEIGIDIPNATLALAKRIFR